MADLFLKGLEFLRKQFEKRADAELCCYLFEYPVIGDAPSGLPWADKRPEAFKWELGTFYRNFKFAEDKRQLIDPGAKRDLYFFGPAKLRNEFLRLAGEAGKLVSAASTTAFPITIPDGTLQAHHDQLRWCYVLFDLAWARISETPLRATEKLAWNGDVLLPLDELPKLRRWNGYEWGRDIAERAARIPDPPSWFSDIEDVWRASVYAVDILIGAASAGASVVSNFTNGKNDGDASQSDIGSDSQKNSGKKPRPLNKEARDCIRAFAQARNGDPAITMKSVVDDYVADHGGSINSIIRRLNDHSEEWNPSRKSDKKATKKRQP